MIPRTLQTNSPDSLSGKDLRHLISTKQNLARMLNSIQLKSWPKEMAMKFNIMFVDDSITVIESLRWILMQLNKRWQ